MMDKKATDKVLPASANSSDNASSILLESVLKTMDEYYRAELSEKIKRGISL